MAHGTWKTTGGGGGGDVGGLLIMAVVIGVAVAVAEALLRVMESLIGAVFMALTALEVLVAAGFLVRAIRRRWRPEELAGAPRRGWMPPLTVIYRDPPPVERQPEPRALPAQQVPTVVNHNYYGTVHVHSAPGAAVPVVRGEIVGE